MIFSKTGGILHPSVLPCWGSYIFSFINSQCSYEASLKMLNAKLLRIEQLNVHGWRRRLSLATCSWAPLCDNMRLASFNAI